MNKPINSEATCRWGILGTATIGRKNWKAIWNADNAHLVAVASRTAKRATQFIEYCQSLAPFDPAPRPEPNYEALLSADDVDAIYIPLPTALRKEWVIRAAESGKHVLVEKPCGVNQSEVREMIDACRTHGVQFMDGVMFMHSDRLPALRQRLDDQSSIGQIRRIATQFSFCGDDQFLRSNIRVNPELEPLGCLGDLGWYTIRMMLWVMNWEMPEAVAGRLIQQASSPGCEGKVPTEFAGELSFPSGATGSMYVSFVTNHQQWAHVSGSRGHLMVEDFVLPYFGCELGYQVTNAEFHDATCDFIMEPHARRYAVAEYGNSMPNSQEAKMFRRFSANVLAGNVEPEWGEMAVKTQTVMDQLLSAADRKS